MSSLFRLVSITIKIFKGLLYFLSLLLLIFRKLDLFLELLGYDFFIFTVQARNKLIIQIFLLIYFYYIFLYVTFEFDVIAPFLTFTANILLFDPKLNLAASTHERLFEITVVETFNEINFGRPLRPYSLMDRSIHFRADSHLFQD